ncbi:ATP-dependent RNA helicase RhlE [Hyphomicrobium sp. 1Nfss2.1]|uniref:DEAD/DEAH box helicase n=1 Tax=Hyphomicrobium sp. 1Nfss2.1 TaxID=3413936 RepID=UPI003C7B3446
MKDILLTDTTSTTFTDLGLDASLLKALTSEGYTTPTPIQAQAIPGVMAGRDLMGIAQTGTGKTAAFALPILHRLLSEPRKPLRAGTRALILSPTRELASQIADSFRTYGKHTGLTVAVMFGGMPIRPQINAVKNGVDILVATPGRLLDHIEQRTVNLSGTEVIVLDEADQMLDMGFIQPIRKILGQLSQRRQSLFFSATMPREIGALASEMLRDPLRVQVTPVAKTADRVRQSVIHVEQQKKASLLVELFSDPALTRTLVFTRTKRGADKVVRHLEAAGILVAAIHGNKSQSQRERALHQFRNGRIRGLIATDIAARGIDIDEVSHVINFELPNIPESYVHRIGRTARAGADGIAISLCAGDERAYLRDIERITRQSIPASDRTGDISLVAAAGIGGGGERTQQHRRGGQRPQAAKANGGGHGQSNGQSRGHHAGRPAQLAKGERSGDGHARPQGHGAGRPQRNGEQHAAKRGNPGGKRQRFGGGGARAAR